MTALTLSTFSTFTEDLVGAVVRALSSLEANGQLAESAVELAAVSRETGALVAVVRRDTEAILANGVEAKGFAAQCAPAAASLAGYLPILTRQRESLSRHQGSAVAAVLSDIDGLIREVVALQRLLSDVVTAAGLPTPAGFWERAAAVKGPFEDGESVMARIRAGGDI
jgi:hypothetical protein